MKKLLSLLSAGILTLTGVGSVVSCSQKVTTIMEDIQEELSQNTEIIKAIEKESLEIFNEFWEDKQIIEISPKNEPGIKDSFTKLVDKVKQEANNGPVRIKSDDFNQYGMINHFYNEFKNIFDNFNADLAKRYSNYFANEKPLVLDPQDVIFKGTYIDFEELQKYGNLVKDVKAVTVTYEIKYSIRFKGQYNPVKMGGAIAITDDLKALNDISKLVSEYVMKELEGFSEKGRNNTIVLDLSKGISYNNVKQEIDNKVEAYLKGKIKSPITFLNSYSNLSDVGYLNKNNTFRYVNQSIINLQGGEQGKLSDKITPDDFANWYMKDVLPKNVDVNDKFPKEKLLYNYWIYNNRIILAGLPLSTEYDKRSNFHTIFVSIKKDEFKKQVELFAREVIAFYKMYQIESYWTKTIFYLPKNLFSDAIKATSISNLGDSLAAIFNFIVVSYNKEEKKSLNVYVDGNFSRYIFHEIPNFSRKINLKDSITFKYDGEEKRRTQFTAINIEHKNDMRLGLVHAADGSKGNQIEFKLKL